MIGVQSRADAKPIEVHPELYIPVQVRPNWLRVVALILLVAAVMWGQQWAAASEKGSVEIGTAMGLLAVALVSSVAVVFGIKTG